MTPLAWPRCPRRRAPTRRVLTSCRLPAQSSAPGQQAQGAFLLEVEGAARGGGNAAEAAAEVSDGRPDRRLRQHPPAARQRRGADVVPALEGPRPRGALEGRLRELPLGRTPPPP